MNIVSVFDGMACGMLAMQKAGIPVDSYVAFEIEKYAIQTSSHNFPMIEHRGDVFQADFTEFKGFDFLIGGSPCTYWSIAQKNNRETVASGMGWELFSQYVRALHEAQPMYFIYENNKSMANAIRESITETFGFEPICINSALVSAQNRQRLYWVGKRNPDGTYSKVHVEQPADRGILLRDVLDGAFSYRCTTDGKGFCLDANYWKTPGSPETFLEGGHARANRSMAIEPLAEPFGETSGKAYALTASYWKGQPKNKILEKSQRTHVAEPVGIGYRGRMEDGKWVKRYESNEQPKANALTTCQTDSMVSEPVRVGTWPNNAKNQAHDSQQYRIYGTDGKSVTLCGNGGGMGAKTGLYAIPVEFDGDRPIKAVSGSDGKEYEVYEVKDGFITIKGKRYAIKLADGFYIIRKLTVTECKRLQTVPEWYEFPVSDTQAYKMLGNGWTVDVIAHLINATQEGQLAEDQLDKHQPHDLKQMQSLPLEAKIIMTQQRIRQWYDHWDGQVYVSFSGGKDSTVLKHIVDNTPGVHDVPAVFVNTGLEYPEIQKFVKDVKAGRWDCFNPDVVILRPEMRFDDVVRTYGYPVVSKEVSKYVKEARSAMQKGKTDYYAVQKLHGTLKDKDGNKSLYNCEKWGFMIDAPYKISNQCCDVMKKRPAKKYTKETGRKPILATMAAESRLRFEKWIRFGCNAFDQKDPSSQPMSFWTEQDVLHYIKKFNIPYCSVYGEIQVKPPKDAEAGQMNVIDYLECWDEADVLETTGCDRTGCIFCMFGCHLEKEPNRFQRLKETHPWQYEYCIGGGEMVDGKWLPSKEGLGLGHVLDYIGVKYD